MIKFGGCLVLSCFVLCSQSSAEGDPEVGKSLFKNCVACHAIRADDGDELVKGGKIGPNLYKVIGRTAGSESEFKKYSRSLKQLADTGYVWDQAGISEWVQNPSKYLKSKLEKPSAKSKMPFKMKSGNEDIAAFLAQISQE